MRCARDGANVIIAAKTADPHPKLPGTIYTAAKEIEEAGGKALPCIVDVRFEDQVAKAFEDGAKKFGGIDILVNNASAISLTGTLDTNLKKYDLMNQVNARGTFLCSKLAIPYLRKSSNPHILNLSPPLNLNPKWFKNNLAYTMAKYGMSFCVLGMSEELKEDGIAVNALWPRTAIATDAIDFIGSVEMRKQSRTTEIMADAAYQIFIKEAKSFSGKFLIDEDLLKSELGLTNFDKYAVEPGNPLLMDFFLDDIEGQESLPMGGKNDQTNGQVDSDVAASMNALKRLLSPELVEKINGVYAFKISDAKTTDWYLDLKNGSGKIDSGVFNGQVNCTMTMNSEVFNKMISGNMKPTMAFMSGKLKIKGDMGLAMKLEKLMSSLKSKL